MLISICNSFINLIVLGRFSWYQLRRSLSQVLGCSAGSAFGSRRETFSTLAFFGPFTMYNFLSEEASRAGCSVHVLVSLWLSMVSSLASLFGCHSIHARFFPPSAELSRVLNTMYSHAKIDLALVVGGHSAGADFQLLLKALPASCDPSQSPDLNALEILLRSAKDDFSHWLGTQDRSEQDLIRMRLFAIQSWAGKILNLDVTAPTFMLLALVATEWTSAFLSDGSGAVSSEHLDNQTKPG